MREISLNNNSKKHSNCLVVWIFILLSLSLSLSLYYARKITNFLSKKINPCFKNILLPAMPGSRFSFPLHFAKFSVTLQRIPRKLAEVSVTLQRVPLKPAEASVMLQRPPLKPAEASAMLQRPPRRLEEGFATITKSSPGAGGRFCNPETGRKNPF